MTKFGRNYTLKIQDKDYKEVIIKPPLTMEFTVDRATLSSANIAVTRIYNLSKEIRERIEKDQLNIGFDRSMELLVGYGEDMPRISFGTLQRVWSYREGQDFITTINSFDGGWAIQQAFSAFSVPAGTKNQDIIRRLVRDLQIRRIAIGGIGSFPGAIERGASFNGNTMDLLNDFTGGRAKIDNGFIYVLQDDEGIESDVVINANTGLLGTPIKEQTFVNFTMLFEPRLHLRQIVTIESTTGVNINGLHDIYSISHQGIVSESINGPMTTTAGFLNKNLFKNVTRGAV